MGMSETRIEKQVIRSPHSVTDCNGDCDTKIKRKTSPWSDGTGHICQASLSVTAPRGCEEFRRSGSLAQGTERARALSMEVPRSGNVTRPKLAPQGFVGLGESLPAPTNPRVETRRRSAPPELSPQAKLVGSLVSPLSSRTREFERARDRDHIEPSQTDSGQMPVS